jgi:sarcosine oxidase gamma subunit
MIPAGCGDLESAGARLAAHQSGVSLSSSQARSLLLGQRARKLVHMGQSVELHIFPITAPGAPDVAQRPPRRPAGRPSTQPES